MYLAIFKTFLSFTFCFSQVALGEDLRASGEKSLRSLQRATRQSGQYQQKDLLHYDSTTLRSLCMQDEAEIQNLENSLVETWIKAWREADWSQFAALTQKPFEVSGVRPSQQVARTFLNGVEQRQWTEEKEGVLWKAEALKNYLHSWKKIEDLNLRIVDYGVSPGTRAAAGLNFNAASIVLRFDVRGFAGKESQRRTDRGLISARVLRPNSEGTWKIASLRFDKIETLTSKRVPAFENATVRSGLEGVPIEKRNEAIRRGGYALSVTDLNGDGAADLYVGAQGPGSLWLGNGQGQFKRMTGSPLEKETAVKTAIFADFANRGQKDAFFTRFVYGENLSDLAYYSQDSAGMFTKEKGRFKGKLKYNMAMPAAAGDFNRDGFLDLYVGFPGERDFTHLVDRSDRLSKVMPQGLFLNSKAQKGRPFFSDATQEYWQKWQLSQWSGNIFPHSALALDYDRDGATDLIVVDDRMNLSPIYHNEGGQRLKAVEELVQISNRGFGMGLAYADYNNDGITDLLITNVNFASLQRMQSACSNHWKWTGTLPENQGIRLFRGTSSGVFVEATREAGLEWAGEGMAGIEFVDYDGDGLQDIYAVNGLWSGSAREIRQDISSLFASAIAARLASLDEAESYNMHKTSRFLDVLRNFQGDVTGGKESARPSLAGWQRNRLYHNDGNGHFTEVGFIEGVDSISDGYVVAKADLNQDGKMDLILRNGDPGTDAYRFPSVEYFENHFPENKTLSLVLQGSKSNRDGVGALAKVKIGERAQYAQLTANNGAAQSELVLAFGLGAATQVDEVEVLWPSQTVQTFKQVAAGRYQLTEGQAALKPILSSDSKISRR